MGVEYEHCLQVFISRIFVCMRACVCVRVCANSQHGEYYGTSNDSANRRPEEGVRLMSTLSNSPLLVAEFMLELRVNKDVMELEEVTVRPPSLLHTISIIPSTPSERNCAVDITNTPPGL